MLIINVELIYTHCQFQELTTGRMTSSAKELDDFFILMMDLKV